MANKDDWQEEEVTSLEDLMEDELREEGHEESDASDEFKALFDEADEEEEFLDEEGLESEELMELSEESEEEDEDSLPLEDSELDESTLMAESDEEEEATEGDESEDLFASEDSTEEVETEATEGGTEEKTLASALEQLTEESEELQFDDEAVDNVLAADESITEDTELGSFESAEIEEKEFVDADTVVSVVESILFSTDKAVGIAFIKKAFEGTTVKTDQIKKAIETIQIEYAGSQRGVFLEEISGGYQLRTKVDNMNYLKRITKGRPFKLSGPALEVLAISAYKQPLIKAEVDEIRGVESGHLMRALMDRGLLRFAGKSELPGKPMLYETTKKFLEIFSLRSLKELPSLSEIDELIPEGIGEEEEKEHLSSVTDNMSLEAANSYSEGEEELGKIEETLGLIDTTTEFFEQEKAREKAREEKLRADGIREAVDFDEAVSDKDRRWLDRYDKKQEELRLAEEKAKEEAELAAQAEALAEETATEEKSEDTETADESAELFADSDVGSTDEIGDESAELFAESETDSSVETEVENSNEEELLEASTDEVGTDLVEEELADESELLLAEETDTNLSTENVDILEEASKEPLAEDSENKDEKDIALDNAFGSIQNALDAFESEDGIDIDAAPETEPKKEDKDKEAEA